MALRVLLFALTNVIATLALRNGSLTFVIDQTGSMQEDISCVIDGSNSIMDVIFESDSSQMKDMVVVTFNDPDVQMLIHSNNRSEIEQQLRGILNVTGGGGDCPEVSLTGLEAGLRESLPGSYVFLFTDDVPKDATEDRIKRIQNLCQEKEIMVFFVLTANPSCVTNATRDFTTYYTIAQFSSGQVFRLTDKSDVSELIYYITEMVNGQRDVITSAVTQARKWTSIPFEIDTQTEYALASTSGDNVQIRVFDDKNISVFDPEQVVWMENVKVIKIENPGKYRALVYGDSEASVAVFGRTEFSFEAAFSRKRVQSFEETEKQVYEGLETYLWISVNEPKHVVNIQSARLLNMEEELIQELPLIKVGADVYMTNIFYPSNVTFKIAVKGIDNTGAEIFRLAKLPVQPMKPKKEPVMECAKEIKSWSQSQDLKNSSEYYFMMSVLMEMEKFSPTQRMKLRIAIDEIILGMMNDHCEAKK